MENLKIKNMKNSNLHKAKTEKNDEFYTQLTDIEKELKHYREHFKGKVIFCNCDDPEWSNFWKYFELNFDFFGLKKLISTHYEQDKGSYKLEIVGDINGDGKVTSKDIIRTELKQNGDFRSDEAIGLLKEADIVVTNPPFSLFREYISLLAEHNKKFIVVGNMNAITNKECFKLIKENRMWLGMNYVKEFVQPDGTVKKFGNINWFTNLEHQKRNEELILYRNYNETDYPKYDNYDAINVKKVKDIPCDYFGIMGVPISFLEKHNPNQFEIIWQASGNTRASAPKEVLESLNYRKHLEDRGGCGIVKGKRSYSRILIKRK
jgi:hypothetical protein